MTRVSVVDTDELARLRSLADALVRIYQEADPGFCAPEAHIGYLRDIAGDAIRSAARLSPVDPREQP